MSRLTEWLRRVSRRELEREVKDGVRAVRGALTPDDQAAFAALARDLAHGRDGDRVAREAVDRLRTIGTRLLREDGGGP